MGRTYRNDKSWDDEDRRKKKDKKSKKNFSSSGMKVLNRFVEEEDEDFALDNTRNHTKHTKHTT